MTTPIILFSDHPASFSGLARITNDLASQIHAFLGDEFRVSTLGYGAPGSCSLPFPQYQWKQRDDFLPTELPFIWKDFCGSDPGILLTIGDIQRFLGLADTTFASDRPFADWMKQMRSTGLLKLWGYFPIDAHSIGGKLGPQLAHTLTHYDRRLVPSEWAREIVRRTLPYLQCDVIPHGIDVEVFKPRPKEEARENFAFTAISNKVWPQKLLLKFPTDTLAIGIVATNQQRKDFGLGIEVVAELRKSRPTFLWIHTDAIKREWSLLELLSDFGLLDSAVVTTGNLSDESMSWLYSAMDVTLGIGRGEGFGYPIAESLACGVPCITSTYGAQSDYVHVADQVDPFRMRIEGPLNLLRPIHHVGAWANAVKGALESCEGPHSLPTELDWETVWPRFASWIKSGVTE